MKQIGTNKNYKLLQHLKGYRLKAFVAPLFKFLEAAFELVVPMLLARVIDIGIENGDTAYIIKNCVYMVILALLGITFCIICQRFATVSSVGYGGQMREALYKHINTLSYSQIDKLNTPTLINNLTIDTVNSQNAFGLFLRLVLRSPFLALGSIVLAFFISARLSLIFLSSVAIIGVLTFFIMRSSIPKLMNINTQTDKITRKVKENLSGTRVIRACTHEEESEEDFKRENEILKKSYLKVNKLLMLGNPLCFLLINVAVILVIYLGGFKDKAGISAGDLVALVNYLTQNLLALLVIIQLTVVFSRSMASNRRIRAVFSEQSEDKNEGGLTEFPAAAEAVVYEGVSFGYKGDKNIINELSFSLKVGGTAAITGSTGSGKSSLLYLLPRFYRERSGNIKLFGKDISEYSVNFLRQTIKIAESVPLLFSGTVRENIKAGSHATDQEILAAIHAASAQSFALDLDKHIEAGGSNLSKGQRQRLGIARALAAKPTILVLDDALSSLDNVTASNIIANIFEEANAQAVFIVTRNEKIIEECDIALCLDC